MKRDIAVVGAGVGGLAVATHLAQDGHRVTVFDQFDTPGPVGSGLVIQPVGLAALAQIGADTMARAWGNPITRMQGDEALTSRRVLDVAYDPNGHGTTGLAIHRAALFAALLDAANRADVDIRSGHVCTGRSGQTLEFGTRRAGPFDLIIDASGAGSPLSPLKARPLAYGALWSAIPWPDGTELPKDELRQVYRKASRMVGVLPMGQLPEDATFLAAVFWSLPRHGHVTWQENGLAAWREEAATLWPEFGPFANAIHAPEQMTFARYTHGTLRVPFSDGVVYIGDAAHRASPQLGQGANMALLDAWALARAMRCARGDLAMAALWYAQARRWHVRIYQMMSRMFTPQYQSNSTWLPVLRDRVLCPLSQIPPVPRILTALVRGDMVPPLGSLTE